MAEAQAFDPLVAIATGMWSQPGQYALLLGSGVSTGAGIPTGWGVVSRLVAMAAAAATPKDQNAIENAEKDPEAWWAEHGDGSPLGYSSLLKVLAPARGARRALLAGFFESTPETTDLDPKTPSTAHRKIAELVKSGHVRVIVTTNFDRLMERALEDIGVSPQVITRPEAVLGMTPLVHAPATVVKLHGDYADLDMRNTVDELETYPDEWNVLLDRILDEFGLVISGWSAEWDKALVSAIERTPSRRYAFVWDSRSSKGETAQRVLTLRQGQQIDASSADDLFARLADSVSAVARLARTPITSAVAKSRLKTYLQDPLRRIDLHDLLMETIDPVEAYLATVPTNPSEFTWQDIDDTLTGYREATRPLLELLFLGTFHDRAGTHGDLWVTVMNRLMALRGEPPSPFNVALEGLRHYPALLALRAVGAATTVAENDDLFLRVLREPRWRQRLGNQDRVSPLEALHDYQVLPDSVAKPLPRWEPTKWIYPASHLLRAELGDQLSELTGGADDTKRIWDQVEYKIALAQQIFNSNGSFRICPGEFLGETRWNFGDDGLVPEKEFMSGLPQDSPWFDQGNGSLDESVAALRETLKTYFQHRF